MACLRPAVFSLALGLLTTLAIAWPMTLALIHFRILDHGKHWKVAHELALPAPPPSLFTIEFSHLWASDWYRVTQAIEWRRRDNVEINTWPLPSWAPDMPPTNRPFRLDAAATGWPFRAFSSEAWFFRDDAGKERVEFRHNLVLFETPNGRTILPLKPIWRGIALDSLLYAVTYYLLWIGLGLAVSWRRLRRARCQSCGYPRAGISLQAACPECGSKPIAASDRDIHAGNTAQP